MEFIGKKIVRYGDVEFIGDEYRFSINNELFEKLLSIANEKQLKGLLEDELRFENYESVNKINQIIKDRFS